MVGQNKLQFLSWQLFHTSLLFVGRAGAIPTGASFGTQLTWPIFELPEKQCQGQVL
jgi:hypothetical protein